MKYGAAREMNVLEEYFMARKNIHNIVSVKLKSMCQGYMCVCVCAIEREYEFN